TDGPCSTAQVNRLARPAGALAKGGAKGMGGGRCGPAGRTAGGGGPQIPGGRNVSRQIRNQPIKGILLAIVHFSSNPSVAVSSWRARCNCALQVPSAIPNAPAASAWLYP